MREPHTPSDDPPSHLSQKSRMADTPRPVDPPVQGRTRKVPLKRSTYYGILLYLLSEFREDLGPEQVAWIVKYQSKLRDEELLRAARFSSSLRTNPIVLLRTQTQIERIRRKIPRLELNQTREPRRIGIGYRDKGALRPLHLRREEGEVVIWDEDLNWLLPPSEVEGKWVSAEEVSCLVGKHLSLAHAVLLCENFLPAHSPWRQILLKSLLG